MRSEYSCHCDRSHDAESNRLSPFVFGVIASLLLFCLAANVPAYGQGAAKPAAADSGRGKLMDGAYVRQSVEFGGHILNLTGSSEMYDTLVNVQDGPRLLDQSLSIETLPKRNQIFDDLYLNSFGWGGEANNVMRLRIDKRGAYRFTATFRRDRTFFDYDLFANPLNSTTPVVNLSPHAMALTRRMYDFDLLLLPQRRLSFVLGLSRTREEGPSLSSAHVNSVDVLLFQPYSTIGNDYRMGLNWRIVRGTTLSFLESLQTLKNFTGQTLDTTDLPGGPYLSAPSGSRSLSAYDRTQSFYAFIPTENVTLTSNSIRNLEFTAHVAYSNADGSTPLSETYTGTNSGGTAVTQDTSGTTASSTWVTNEADLGATYHISPRWRLVDTFRFSAYRLPGYLNLLGTVTTGGVPAATNELDLRMSQQSVKSNEFTVQYDLRRNLGVRVGYLYRNVFDAHIYYVCPGLAGVPPDFTNCVVPANVDENEPLTISQHTAIAGAWYRLGRKIRANGEVRITSSDDFLTRIDPRREQSYRANVTYTPLAWLTVGANANLREQRNNTQGFGYNAHWRNFGFNAMASPNSRLTLETDYEYTNLRQNGNICFAYGATNPNGTIPGTFVQPCPNDTTGSASVWGGLADYSTETHYGNLNVIFKPVHRVTASLGYSVISVDGSELILNALQPTGPLSYFYHRPQASLAVQICKPIELRAGWNYYQYNENGATGPTPSRYFHANVTTLSARYSF